MYVWKVPVGFKRIQILIMFETTHLNSFYMYMYKYDTFLARNNPGNEQHEQV